ncbi:hypothetical protein [Kitasatospora sp. NPDC089509]|uniref:hypothetical protein n=1 Tax=Kitasatospora sp. NPDC089509 TaxID=3364079 RepID=UPI00382B85F3
MPVPTLRRTLGTVGLALAAAVVATAVTAPSATAAEARGTAGAVAVTAPATAPVHELPEAAADFRHWGGAYADRASADAAGALLQLSGTAIAFVVELVNNGAVREFVLWYW